MDERTCSLDAADSSSPFSLWDTPAEAALRKEEVSLLLKAAPRRCVLRAQHLRPSHRYSTSSSSRPPKSILPISSPGALSHPPH